MSNQHVAGQRRRYRRETIERLSQKDDLTLEEQGQLIRARVYLIQEEVQAACDDFDRFCARVHNLSEEAVQEWFDGLKEVAGPFFD